MAISREEAGNMLEQIKRNRALLESCPQHSFGAVIGDRSAGLLPSANMRVCQNCKGTMPDRDIIFYAKGYKAAGGNPDDIGKFCDGESLA